MRMAFLKRQESIKFCHSAVLDTVVFFIEEYAMIMKKCKENFKKSIFMVYRLGYLKKGIVTFAE